MPAETRSYLPSDINIEAPPPASRLESIKEKWELAPNRPYTLIMIKPLGINLVPEIMARLAEAGDIVAPQIIHKASKEQVCAHYSHSQYDKLGHTKPHYIPLIEYITNKRLITLILQSKEGKPTQNHESFVHTIKRDIIGPGDPSKTKPSHIRSFAKYLPYVQKPKIPEYKVIEGVDSILDNVIHGSANAEEALEEISTWYKNSPSLVRQATNIYTTFKETHH